MPDGDARATFTLPLFPLSKRLRDSALGHLDKRYLQGEGGESPNWFRVLPDLIAQMQAFHGTPPQLIEQALRAGRCLLLFDGLDEVAERQARLRLARSLADFQRLASGNRIIIGSRLTGLSDSETALSYIFQQCEIQPFTPKDLQRFFRFWYALDNDLSAEQQEQG